MALRRELNRPNLTTDARHALIRIRSHDLETLERHVFQRYPDREWGTFFRFGYRRAPWGLAVCYVSPILPGPGDLDRQSPLTVFRDQYTRRAFAASGQDGLAVGVVHSHPLGFATFPSALDDDMDVYFSRELAAYGRGAPYCSLILQRHPTTGLTFSARVFDRGEWLPATTLLSVGKAELTKWVSEVVPNHPAVPGGGAASDATIERLRSLFGIPAAERLRRSAVGVIGCSGTGSPAVEVLARAQVGEFVLVDPQRVASSNVERMHGSTPADAACDPPPYKVELMRRMILSINPHARVTALVGNVLHDNVVDELLRCDAVLGCTDSFHGRVALSDLGHHYLLPSIDTGVLMDGAGGRVTSQLAEFNIYSPDLPCAFCSEVVDSGALAEELMTDAERDLRRAAAEDAARRGDLVDQYWKGRPRQLHTVGYLTTAVGALGAGYLEGWISGTSVMPHDRFQFDVGKPRLGVVAPPRVRIDGCSCGKHIGWADQAKPHRNVTLPPHWPRRAILTSRDGY